MRYRILAWILAAAVGWVAAPVAAQEERTADEETRAEDTGNQEDAIDALGDSALVGRTGEGLAVPEGEAGKAVTPQEPDDSRTLTTRQGIEGEASQAAGETTEEKPQGGRRDVWAGDDPNVAAEQGETLDERAYDQGDGAAAEEGAQLDEEAYIGAGEGEMEAAGAKAGTGTPSLSAELVDKEKKAQKKEAKVKVQVSGLQLVDAPAGGEPQPGQGHLHYRVDDGPVIATTEGKLSLHELSSGEHTIVVQVVDNAHQPLGPEERLEVSIP